MNGKGKAIKVLCPHCRRKMYKYTERVISNGMQQKEISWRCPVCVFAYPENYFDVFTQFEDWVLREGEDEKQFEALAKNDVLEII